MYQVQRAARSEFIKIRQVDYHVLVWGEAQPGKTPLVMVHGWMDVAASFQFVFDCLKADHWIIAPDWRGYGLSSTGGGDSYWLADYMADLDFLLDHYAPEQPVNLVGHSLGGNVVMHYAGVRPARIHRLINLEGFGMPVSRASQAPGRYAAWFDELKQYHRGELALKPYDDVSGVARRLMKTNPRLARDQAGRDKAEWLAGHWARQNASGQWEILGDAAHKIGNAHISHVDETLELYRRITAPTLCVVASENQMAQWWKNRYTLDEFQQRIQNVPQLRQARIEDAGHMLHHDQPAELARLIDEFIAG